MRLPVLRALLLRGTHTPAAAQRTILVVASAMLCGFLAGSAEPAQESHPGGLPSILGSFEQFAAYLLGMAAGLRLITWLHEDQQEGWVTQLLAGGVARDRYLAALAGATIVTACGDYLLALASFSAIHVTAGHAPPLARMAGVVPAAMGWLAAATGLAASCALLMNERTRARFAFTVLLLLPYATFLLVGMVNDDEPPPLLVIHALFYLVPAWAAPLTLRHGGYLALYTGSAYLLALLLAPRRIDRTV
jgi:hypothetical protein